MVPREGLEPSPVGLRVRYAAGNTCGGWSRHWELNPDKILTKDLGYLYIMTAYDGAGDRIRTGTCSLEGFYAAVNTTPAY